MDSEKVKEIKKALECCSISCKDCPYDKGETTNPICINYLTKNALTLINELESENDTLHTNLCEWRKENQKLKDRIAELEKQRVLCDGTNLEETEENNILEMFCKECKSKALKQFAERLKEMPFNIEFTFKESSYEDIKKLANLMKEYSVKYIDETLKEFIDR